MPIPTWTAIPDSMVAPEAPVSSDLMTRLRDQWASVFGFDPTSVTQPPFTLPFSKQDVQESNVYFAAGGVGTITASERVLSVIATSVEDWQSGNAISAFTYAFTASGGFAKQYGIISANANYVSGAPTSVDIAVHDALGGSVSVVNVTDTNTYQTIKSYSDGGGNTLTIQAKMRVTSTTAYLQLRSTTTVQALESVGQTVLLPFTRKSFLSKL